MKVFIGSSGEASSTKDWLAAEIEILGHSPLPNHEVIVSVIEDLKEVLYPGYRRRERLHLGNITYHVGDLIDGLHDKLTTQIARALRHEERVQDTVDLDDPTDHEAKGQAMAITFLERIPDLRKILATDVQAAFDGGMTSSNAPAAARGRALLGHCASACHLYRRPARAVQGEPSLR